MINMRTSLVHIQYISYISHGIRMLHTAGYVYRLQHAHDTRVTMPRRCYAYGMLQL